MKFNTTNPCLHFLLTVLYISSICSNLVDLLGLNQLKRGSGRIVGGYEVRPSHKYPFVVSIQYYNTKLELAKFQHSCGGSLITKDKVISAGHCGFDSLDKFQVQINRHNLTKGDAEEGGITMKFSSRVIHPKFTRAVDGVDISIWTLDWNSTKSNLTKFPVVNLQLDNGELGSIDQLMGTVVGWGRLNQNGPVATNLMEVKLPIVNNRTCHDGYTNYHVQLDLNSQLCAGYFEDMGQDACQGDSGGPLFVLAKDNTPYLIGIVSYGIGCANPNLPGLYARVSYLTPFILENI